jgi:hypothetical protein
MNKLQKAIEELKKEQNKQKKKKPVLELLKEKRLSYYSNWHKKDKPVNKLKSEKQTKLK